MTENKIVAGTRFARRFGVLRLRGTNPHHLGVEALRQNVRRCMLADERDSYDAMCRKFEEETKDVDDVDELMQIVREYVVVE